MGWKSPECFPIDADFTKPVSRVNITAQSEGGVFSNSIQIWTDGSINCSEALALGVSSLQAKLNQWAEAFPALEGGLGRPKAMKDYLICSKATLLLPPKELTRGE